MKDIIFFRYLPRQKRLVRANINGSVEILDADGNQEVTFDLASTETGEDKSNNFENIEIVDLDEKHLCILESRLFSHIKSTLTIRTNEGKCLYHYSVWGNCSKYFRTKCWQSGEKQGMIFQPDEVAAISWKHCSMYTSSFKGCTQANFIPGDPVLFTDDGELEINKLKCNMREHKLGYIKHTIAELSNNRILVIFRRYSPYTDEIYSRCQDTEAHIYNYIDGSDTVIKLNAPPRCNTLGTIVFTDDKIAFISVDESKYKFDLFDANQQQIVKSINSDMPLAISIPRKKLFSIDANCDSSNSEKILNAIGQLINTKNNHNQLVVGTQEGDLAACDCTTGKLSIYTGSTWVEKQEHVDKLVKQGIRLFDKKPVEILQDNDEIDADSLLLNPMNATVTKKL